VLREAFPDLEDLHEDGVATSGENILIDGLHRHNLCIGDLFGVQSPTGEWRSCLLQISSPRKPCKRWDTRYGSAGGLSVRHFVLTNTCGGFFFRVLRPGFIVEGDMVTLIHRPIPKWNLNKLGRKLYGAAGGHIDTWTNWTGTLDELNELVGLEDLAMCEWRDVIVELHKDRTEVNKTEQKAPQIANHTFSVDEQSPVVVPAPCRGTFEDP